MADMLCKECGETKRYHARGLCSDCYYEARKKGELNKYPAGLSNADLLAESAKKYEHQKKWAWAGRWWFRAYKLNKNWEYVKNALDLLNKYSNDFSRSSLLSDILDEVKCYDVYHLLKAKMSSDLERMYGVLKKIDKVNLFYDYVVSLLDFIASGEKKKIKSSILISIDRYNYTFNIDIYCDAKDYYINGILKFCIDHNWKLEEKEQIFEKCLTIAKNQAEIEQSFRKNEMWLICAEIYLKKGMRNQSKRYLQRVIPESRYIRAEELLRVFEFYELLNKKDEIKKIIRKLSNQEGKTELVGLLTEDLINFCKVNKFEIPDIILKHTTKGQKIMEEMQREENKKIKESLVRLRKECKRESPEKRINKIKKYLKWLGNKPRDYYSRKLISKVKQELNDLKKKVDKSY